MENVIAPSQVKLSWFNKHCRKLVFHLLSQLKSGVIDVVEGDKTYSFGDTASATQSKPKLYGKLIVIDPTTYTDFVKGGSIGAAEAFIANKWETPDLTMLIRIFARAEQVIDKLESKMAWLTKCKNFLFHKRNRNTQTGSKKNILAHYDLGNELYTRFLDQEMMYSAAIYPFKNASLEEAQIHKLKLICERLDLQPSDHLLEIGTGWGGLAIYAAQHYGCKVTTTTISDAQHDYAQARINELKLNEQIILLKKDYRDLTGEFDKLVSIEMIEAVGFDFMDSFFAQCNARLKPGGKMLIQAITIADQRFEQYLNSVDFIQRYIFPGGFLPSIEFMNRKLRQQTECVLEELHDIGLDYAQTLADWRTRFLNAYHELKPLGYDEAFKRLWLYYLGYCEGGFLERSISTVHFIARK